jgi:ELWxxDGT repeat protein
VNGVGIELCRTDGTPGGTQLFADLAPGTSGSRPNGFVAGSPPRHTHAPHTPKITALNTTNRSR